MDGIVNLRDYKYLIACRKRPRRLSKALRLTVLAYARNERDLAAELENIEATIAEFFDEDLVAREAALCTLVVLAVTPIRVKHLSFEGLEGILAKTARRG